jgi:hypothetical protein
MSKQRKKYKKLALLNSSLPSATHSPQSVIHAYASLWSELRLLAMRSAWAVPASRAVLARMDQLWVPASPADDDEPGSDGRADPDHAAAARQRPPRKGAFGSKSATQESFLAYHRGVREAAAAAGKASGGRRDAEPFLEPLPLSLRGATWVTGSCEPILWQLPRPLERFVASRTPRFFFFFF